MGMLYDGKWVDRAPQKAPTARGGEYHRAPSQFRGWLDGAEGASPVALWPIDPHRYRLYVALACPWAHRTLIVRALYGLEAVLPVATVAPEMMGEGWVFDAAHPDRFEHHAHLRSLYLQADPQCTSRVTVPVLWDARDKTIVNNESSEIIRMLAGPFARLGRMDAPLAGYDLRPAALRAEIDVVNERVYDRVNNGVYRTGFATTQAAYDRSVHALFDTLDWLESRLRTQRWLVGNRFSEADLRLFPTLVRFDAVYYGHFKCSVRKLKDYPALSAWTRDVYQLPGVAQTVNLDDVRRHYYFSHRGINPCGIVPAWTPEVFSAPTGRALLGPTPVAPG